MEGTTKEARMACLRCERSQARGPAPRGGGAAGGAVPPRGTAPGRAGVVGRASVGDWLTPTEAHTDDVAGRSEGGGSSRGN
jgi:hypothetical protein